MSLVVTTTGGGDHHGQDKFAFSPALEAGGVYANHLFISPHFQSLNSSGHPLWSPSSSSAFFFFSRRLTPHFALCRQSPLPPLNTTFNSLAADVSFLKVQPLNHLQPCQHLTSIRRLFSCSSPLNEYFTLSSSFPSHLSPFLSLSSLLSTIYTVIPHQLLIQTHLVMLMIQLFIHQATYSTIQIISHHLSTRASISNIYQYIY